MKNQFLPSRSSASAISFCALIFLLANSNNPPNGKTGAPFDGNCTDCHSPANTSYNGTATISGLPSSITAGQVYQLTFTGNATMGSPSRAGFQLVLVDGANANAGTLTPAGSDTGTNTSGGRTYIEQRNAKSLSGGMVSWNFSWTAPTTASGNQIKAYAALNLVNGSGTSGDRVINMNQTYTLASPPPPVTASIQVNSNVTCNGGNNGSATVTAVGGTPNYTYAWSNGASSATNSNLAAGQYTVTITDTNAQSTTASITISQPSAISATSSVSNNITCAQSSAVISVNASGGTGNLSYQWSNGTTGASITVTQPGPYIVTVTDIEGCTKTSMVTVQVDTSIPVAYATSDDLSCNVSSVQIQLSVSSISPVTSYAWTGPNNFSSNQQNPIVSAPGDYTAVVTTANGCTSTAIATVFQDTNVPNLVATGGQLSCANNQVNLQASSSTANVTYAWLGPNGFTSTNQNPSVSTSGTYTVVVQAANGCTSQQSVTVTEDSNTPTSSITGNTLLTCANTSTELTAISNGVNDTYMWSNGIAGPTVSTGFLGTYSVTVTGQNGCTSENSITVNQDISAPNISTTAGTLTCVNATAELCASSTASNLSYTWSTLNGGLLTGACVTVDLPGTYTVTATDMSNQCTSTSTAEVELDGDFPENVAVTGGTLTCTNSTVQLMCTTTTPDVNYQWSGPSGFSSTAQNPSITMPGPYTVVVTSNQNGCSVPAEVLVDINNVVPTVSTSVSSLLSCTNFCVQIATQVSNASTYAWSGPNGYTSTSASIDACMPGTYTLVVTANSGCTASSSVLVMADQSVPALSIAAAEISCLNPSVELTTTATGGNLDFAWTGPNNFTSNLQSPTVATAGTYTLVANNPANGCSAQSSILVTGNTDEPVLSISYPSVITCTDTCQQIIAQSNIPGTSFEWLPSFGTPTNAANFTYCASTGYTELMGTAPNHCTALVEVDEATLINTTPPNLSVSGVEPISCTNTSVVLTPSSDAGATISWFSNGNQIGMGEISILAPGTYTVISTSADNGCTTSQTVEIEADTDVNVTINSVTAPSCSYSEDGAFVLDINGMIETFTDLASGTYDQTVTASNGCSTIVPITIPATAPIQVNVLTTVLVEPADVEISVMGGSGVYNYNWRLNGVTVSNDQNPTGLIAGDYMLEVRDDMGCLFEFGPYTVSPLVHTTNILDAIAFKVYPSPTQGDLFIELDKTQMSDLRLNYAVYNALGTLLLSEHSSDSKVLLDLAFLPQGLYLLRISDLENGKVSRTVEFFKD